MALTPLTESLTFPSPPPPPDTIPLSSSLRDYLESMRAWALDLTKAAERAFGQDRGELNSYLTLGDDIASATTIAPSRRLHIVTGTATISTITPPIGFSGLLILIAGGAWALTTGGNISRAVSAATGRANILVYVPREATWYPSV